MEGYIGTIYSFAGNTAPRNWAFCHGQLLSVKQNLPLFSVIGKTYGGDGVVNFALPDLRGKAAVQASTDAGFTPFPIGTMAGNETAVMKIANLPDHVHSGLAPTTFKVGTSADTDTPGHGVYIGPVPNGFSPRKTEELQMKFATFMEMNVMPTAGQPIPVVQPYLAVNFIICVMGIFPPHDQ